MRWMNLEPIIQCKVRKKDKYCILTHIYGIYKNSTEEFIYRAEDEMYRKSNMETYITVCKIDNQHEFALWLRKQGLYINLERWDGERDGKEVQKGGDICIPITDSC